METIFIILIIVPILSLLLAVIHCAYKKYCRQTEEYKEVTFPQVTFSNLISFDATDSYRGSDYSLI